MDWHWYYIWGIAWTVTNVWALLTPTQPVDPVVEAMWNENF